jgi:hypothetical protein
MRLCVSCEYLVTHNSHLAQAAFFEREDDLGRDGTLAPERRAFDNPIAIACFGLLCSPFLKCRISVSTSFCALGPYLRPEDFLREEDELFADELLREDFLELDFVAIAHLLERSFVS